jgi:hypothetical protein
MLVKSAAARKLMTTKKAIRWDESPCFAALDLVAFSLLERRVRHGMDGLVCGMDSLQGDVE